MPKCTEAQCHIADTGECLEGHTDHCPHLIADLEAKAASDSSAAQDAGRASEPFRFHSGEKLTVAQASDLLRERPVQMVLFAGAKGAGKTTLLARIGELFRSGSMADYRFAWSKSLSAFERMSWLATIACGAGRPDTPRTSRIENDTFLHLRVHERGMPMLQRDLLISDLAGETFPTAVASRDFCRDLRALARADHIVLCLDSGDLADPALRHSERDNALGFLRQAQMVLPNARSVHLQVVFSRWDYITRKDNSKADQAFCRTAEDDIRGRYGATFASIEFWRVAARPDMAAPTDDAISALFADWVSPQLSPTVAVVARPRRTARDFSAFGLQ